MYKISLIIAFMQYMFYQTVSFPQDEFSDIIYRDYGPEEEEAPLDLCELPSNLGYSGKFLYLGTVQKLCGFGRGEGGPYLIKKHTAYS